MTVYMLHCHSLMVLLHARYGIEAAIAMAEAAPDAPVTAATGDARLFRDARMTLLQMLGHEAEDEGDRAPAAASGNDQEIDSLSHALLQEQRSSPRKEVAHSVKTPLQYLLREHLLKRQGAMRRRQEEQEGKQRGDAKEKALLPVAGLLRRSLLRLAAQAIPLELLPLWHRQHEEPGRGDVKQWYYDYNACDVILHLRPPEEEGALTTGSPPFFFRAHTAFLLQRAPYFRYMLTSDFAEGAAFTQAQLTSDAAPVITITEISAEVSDRGRSAVCNSLVGLTI